MQDWRFKGAKQIENSNTDLTFDLDSVMIAHLNGKLEILGSSSSPAKNFSFQIVIGIVVVIQGQDEHFSTYPTQNSEQVTVG